MKSVGIKRLKARLSEYVRYAKSGETVLITERDEVVAELRPSRNRRAFASEIEDTLDGLSDTGELARAVIPKKSWSWRVKGMGLPEGTAQGLLDELRHDRS